MTPGLSCYSYTPYIVRKLKFYIKSRQDFLLTHNTSTSLSTFIFFSPTKLLIKLPYDWHLNPNVFHTYQRLLSKGTFSTSPLRNLQPRSCLLQKPQRLESDNCCLRTYNLVSFQFVHCEKRWRRCKLFQGRFQLPIFCLRLPKCIKWQSTYVEQTI